MIDPEQQAVEPEGSARADGLIEVPGRGRRHERNRLNDLTGREWLYFLNSVEATNYPVSGPESYGHNLRREHPSPKPPQLMAKLIRFFTRQGGWVLDPFAGVGGTLLGCSLEGRHGVGIELWPRWIDVYRATCRQEGLAEQIILAGDARNLNAMPEVAARRFDLILTDPPYGEMLARPQTGEKRKRTGRQDPTPFTPLPEDLGNLPRGEFLTALQGILWAATTYLKEHGHLVVFAKDLQPNDHHHNMLHADIVATLSNVPTLKFIGYKIWYDRTISLYPFGYPHAFVANQLHQFILIFRKRVPRPRARRASSAT